jgi:hydrogenase expression/formation protein HypC
MCLAIPGKLIEISVNPEGVRMGRANFGGIVKQVCLEYTPEVNMGDYVLVHVGFALSKVDEDVAARTYALLEDMKQLSELEDGGLPEEIPAGSVTVGAGPGGSGSEPNTLPPVAAPTGAGVL